MGNFNNLATHSYEYDIDKQVYEELKIANIPGLELPSYLNTEVKTGYIGILNGFVFYRAWKYWICKGDMPLKEAKYIYENYKDLDIRAGGHCGNVEPESVSYNPIYQNQLNDLFKKYSVKEGIELSKNIIDDKTQPRFVDMYHIDTQLGLCKLAQIIREHNISCKMKNLDS